MIAIQTQQLSRSFAQVHAVRDLSLSVSQGHVYGLVGRNGAGKSTILRLLAGLLRPDQGRAELLGRQMREADEGHRARFVYVPQSQRLYEDMSVDQHARWFADIYPLWQPALFENICKRFEIPRHRLIGQCSGGQQRLAILSLALATSSEVLLLDEPAAGLDPLARRSVLAALVEVLAANEGRSTVLLSTHLLSDIERIADQVGVMDGGQLLLSDNLESLRSRFCRLQIIFSGNRVPTDFHIPQERDRCDHGPVYSAVVEVKESFNREHLKIPETAKIHRDPIGLEDLVISLLGRRIMEDGE